MSRHYILMTLVPFPSVFAWCLTWEAIERVCEISADLTGIPRSEFTMKTAENGKVYFKIVYAIALTFRNSLKFELVFNGKVYETIAAKY